ncbi:hypothetical protein HDU76_002962, partial [Blyttiomyces sp. JEL0837]
SGAKVEDFGIQVQDGGFVDPVFVVTTSCVDEAPRKNVSGKVCFDGLPEPAYGAGLLLTSWKQDLFDSGEFEDEITEEDVEEEEKLQDGDFLWNTPLLHALIGRVNNKMIDVAIRLIGRGANINRINRIGNSILHEVLRLGSSRLYDALRLLLHFGADPTHRDVHNRTPMDIVQSHPIYSKDPLILNIFVDHMFIYNDIVNNSRFIAPNPFTFEDRSKSNSEAWKHNGSCHLVLMGIVPMDGSGQGGHVNEGKLTKNWPKFRVGNSLAYLDDVRGTPTLGSKKKK